jgi:hypothetical protein
MLLIMVHSNLHLYIKLYGQTRNFPIEGEAFPHLGGSDLERLRYYPETRQVLTFYSTLPQTFRPA